MKWCLIKFKARGGLRFPGWYCQTHARWVSDDMSKRWGLAAVSKDKRLCYPHGEPPPPKVGRHKFVVFG